MCCLGFTFSLGYRLAAAAGAKGEVTLYTVEAARILRLTGVTVTFPAGQAFKLEVSLFRGPQQVLPNIGVFAGDGSVLHVACDIPIQSGERVRLQYNNTDAVSSQSAHVTLSGILE